MVRKFKVKLDNAELGPYDVSHINQLLDSKKINENTLLKPFPMGEWKKLNEYAEFNKTQTETLTTVMNPPNIEIEKAIDEKEVTQERSEFKEFTYSKDKNENPEIGQEELQENYDANQLKQSVENAPKSKEFEKTKITSINKLKEPIEATRVVTPLIIEEVKEEIKEEIKEEEEKEVIDSDSKTVMVNLADLIKDSDKEIESIESELEVVKQEEEKERRVMLREIEKEADEEETEEELEEAERERERLELEAAIKKKKKIKTLIIGFASLFLLYEFVFDTKKVDEKIVPRYPQISFPIIKEFKDNVKSKEAYARGLKFYSNGDYISKITAADSFRESLEFNFQKNPSLGNLILTYADLLPHSKDHIKSGETLIRLIKIAKNRSLTDPNVVLGSAKFFYENKKYTTAKNMIENFFRIGKPTLEMYSFYLDALVKSGDLDQARKLYEKIEKIKVKNINSYLSMANFLITDQRFDDALKILQEGIKKFGKAVQLYISYGDILIRNSKFSELVNVLSVLKEQNANYSPLYLSRYYEFLGVLNVAKKQINSASQYFKLALAINESDELRSKLASLDLEGNKAIESMVLESKVLQKIRLSEKEFKDKNWEDAFQYAIEATDLNDKYIPAKILLAKIQVKRGFYESALKTLEELKKDFSFNKNINYNWALGLINSYKLDKAKAEISNLSQSEFRQTPEYLNLLSRYYLKINEVNLGLKYLNDATKLDPLNDDNFYLLGEYFLKYRKYNEAQLYLSQAIELDPDNVDYRALWARILYELEGADTAIGYLRDILEKFPDSPKVIGDIAMYYFKSGQLKEYEIYKEKIESSSKKDQGLYEFLIESAKLNENSEDVILNSKELIKLNPGDLEARETLGIYYLKMNNIKDAEDMFMDIRSRLSTYPKVNYYLAKIYMKSGKDEKAMEVAEEEIKNNPTREEGYYIKAEVLTKRKNYIDAMRNLEKAITLNSKNVDVLISLANIKRKQNFLPEARELVLRALQEQPSNSEIHKELGFIYQGLGQSELAIESFETYLKLNPVAQDQDKINAIIKNLKI